MKRYCGRRFTGEEIGQLCALIADNPGRTRAQLSRLACRLLQWRKADGGLKEMSCRVAMLRMHREGLLQLPPPRNRKGGSSRIEHTFWSAPQPLLSRPVHELPGVHLAPVLSRPDSALWNEYIDRYHYLGYTPLPGAQLRCFARWENRLLALLGFGAPAWKTAPRDRFIGWCPSERERNLQLIVNNARFLILPWVQSKNLASKLLALASRQLPQDWQDRYAYRPVLLETFVETQRFTGACYKAANWIHVGQTQGRGKLDRDHKADLPTKSIWLYPLSRHSSEERFAPLESSRASSAGHCSVMGLPNIYHHSAILEATTDFVGIASADGRLQYVNPAGLEMCGFEKETDVTKYRVQDFHPEWTNKLLREEFFPICAKEGVWSGELEFFAPRWARDPYVRGDRGSQIAKW